MAMSVGEHQAQRRYTELLEHIAVSLERIATALEPRQIATALEPRQIATTLDPDKEEDGVRLGEGRQVIVDELHGTPDEDPGVPLPHQERVWPV